MTVSDRLSEHKYLSQLTGTRVVSLAIVAALAFTVATPTIALAAPQSLSNRDQRVTPTEVSGALRNTPGIVESSDQIRTTTDADSAINAATAGATIDVPKQATDGVTIASANGPAIDISLPNAAASGQARQVANGVVAYEATNGSANAVQADENGGVRMLTVIDNPTAPTAYSYQFSLPRGGELALASDGSVLVTGSGDELLATIEKPWARDAKGRSIKTYYAINANTLTQYVQHNVAGIAYPVTADPWTKRWYGWDFEYTRRQTRNLKAGLIATTVASMWVPDPTVTKVMGSALLGMDGYISWVYDRGGCIKVRVTYALVPIVGHYFGGNCR